MSSDRLATAIPEQQRQRLARRRPRPRMIALLMTKSLLGDAFAHHVWATLKLIDVCLELTTEQLQTAVPGTYGTILGTFQHLVGADASYLSVMRGHGGVDIGDGLEMPALRAHMEQHAVAWPEL